MTNIKHNPGSIGEVQEKSLIRARQIDGADHNVRRTMSGKCLICGKRTHNDPTTPYAPVHNAE